MKIIHLHCSKIAPSSICESYKYIIHTHSHTHMHAYLLCMHTLQCIHVQYALYTHCNAYSIHDTFHHTADVWNRRAFSLIPLFYMSFVLLPSPAALSVWPFSALGPFSWFLFPETSIFRKVGSFVWLFCCCWAVKRWVCY